MLPAISIFGIFMSVVLLYFNAQKVTPWVYLIILFLVVSITGLNFYVLLHSKSVLLVGLMFVQIGSLSFIGGPALYWYIRSILTGNSTLTQKDLWHLVPMIVNFALVLPYMRMPYAYKLLIAQQVVQNVDFILTFQPTPLSNQLIFVARPVHFLGYALFSFGLFLRHQVLKKNERILSMPRFLKRWFYILFSFPLILMIGDALIMLKVFELGTFTNFFALNGYLIFTAGFIGIILSPFFFPSVLYGMSNTSDAVALPRSFSTAKKTLEEAEGKKATLYLENDYLHSIGEQADAYMQTFQPFLNPDLNLIQFSVMLKIPTHHLSHYFREVRMQSFIDYRNTWRVQYAKQRITEGLASGLTLEAIGIQSGFSTRSSFIAAFKKSEGISPSAFAAQYGK